ncbi:MAG: DUF2383 domain-containing protein [Holophagales bacterium]|nr:DUF2383 domain-containing protein [Holophagales bacterium]
MSTSSLLTRNHLAVEIDALCSILRTEHSACETYRTAVHAVERDGGCPALSLRCLYRSHRHFADELRDLVRGLGGRPTETVGAWGVWSSVHERVAEMQGRTAFPAMLRTLRHGEQYSLEVGREALHDLEGPAAVWARGRFVQGIVSNLDLLEALERSLAEEADRSFAP